MCTLLQLCTSVISSADRYDTSSYKSCLGPVAPEMPSIADVSRPEIKVSARFTFVQAVYYLISITFICTFFSSFISPPLFSWLVSGGMHPPGFHPTCNSGQSRLQSFAQWRQQKDSQLWVLRQVSSSSTTLSLSFSSPLNLI